MINFKFQCYLKQNVLDVAGIFAMNKSIANVCKLLDMLKIRANNDFQP